jgi:hypothetical protein
VEKKLGNYMIHLVTPSSTLATVYKWKKPSPLIVGNGKKLSWTILNKCGLGTASEFCYTNIIQQTQALRFSQE